MRFNTTVAHLEGELHRIIRTLEDMPAEYDEALKHVKIARESLYPKATKKKDQLSLFEMPHG